MKEDYLDKMIPYIGGDNKESAKIFYQIVKGLHEIIKKGYLYRDLKLDNIIMMPDRTIKIIDLGRCIPQEIVSDDEVYILWYRAPEVLEGGPASIASEVWSLGVCFWDVLSRGKSYLMRGSDERCQAILLKNKKLVPPFSEVTMDLLHGMLEYDPKNRFSFDQILNHKYFDDVRWDEYIEVSHHIEEIEEEMKIPLKSWVILADWLFSVIKEMKWSIKVYMRALHYSKVYFRKIEVEGKLIQLVGLTGLCLSLMKEDIVLSNTFLCDLCLKAYTVEDIEISKGRMMLGLGREVNREIKEENKILSKVFCCDREIPESSNIVDPELLKLLG